MSKIYFKCTLLSNVVLSSTSTTEGSPDTLDYIPGSNFLGIVAKSYADFKEESFNLFHSGKLVFSDAHLLIRGKQSFKKPVDWFGEKLKPENLHSHLALKKEQRDSFRKEGIQLKQVRKGYFTEEGEEAQLTQDFSIKSAYDSEKRMSKENQMYGYHSIPSGSTWLFCVESEYENLCKIALSKLEGRHNIGRSRSAEYGRVEIEKWNDSTSPKMEPVEQLQIYLHSQMALFDKNTGEATYKIAPYHLGLPEESSVDWTKSQVQTRTYAPWNGKRKTRDPDRHCLDKGSVICIKNLPSNFNIKDHAKKCETTGFGAYLNEGFGKVLINPSFLKSDNEGKVLLKLNHDSKTETKQSSVKKSDASDAGILAWVTKQSEKEANKNKVSDKVSEFMGRHKMDFSKITPSQWGGIRSMVDEVDSFEQLKSKLFKDDTGYLRHGVSEPLWRNCYESLKKVIEDNKQTWREFTIKLCAEFGKGAK